MVSTKTVQEPLTLPARTSSRASKSGAVPSPPPASSRQNSAPQPGLKLTKTSTIRASRCKLRCHRGTYTHCRNYLGVADSSQMCSPKLPLSSLACASRRRVATKRKSHRTNAWLDTSNCVRTETARPTFQQTKAFLLPCPTHSASSSIRRPASSYLQGTAALRESKALAISTNSNSLKGRQVTKTSCSLKST